MIVLVSCVESQSSVVYVVLDPVVIDVVMSMPVVLGVSDVVVYAPTGEMVMPMVSLVPPNGDVSE